MQNSKTTIADQESFVWVGPAFAGKTSQIVTLPKPCFVYFTDPKGPSCIQRLGADVDYEIFVRDPGVDEKGNPVAPKAATKLRQDLATKLKSGFFKPYKSIVLDNVTFLFDMVYDEFVATRGVKNDQGIREIDTMRHAMPLRGQVLQVLAELRNAAFGDGGSRSLVFIAHQQDKEDSFTGNVTERSISAWGKLEEQIPAYVNHVFYFEKKIVGDKVLYRMITQDATYKKVGTLWRDVAPVIDVTIKDFTKPEEYGVGKLIAAHRSVVVPGAPATQVVASTPKGA